MIMELEKRTVGSVDASRTAQAALAFARGAEKESSLGCTTRCVKPEGFKLLGECLRPATEAIRWVLSPDQWQCVASSSGAGPEHEAVAATKRWAQYAWTDISCGWRMRSSEGEQAMGRWREQAMSMI